jgi:predicted nucleotide-binding protein (sugar kinase/HSP70/actin superfamily)
MSKPQNIDDKLKEWIEYFNEAREIRRRFANWEFIKKQPPKIRIALEYYIETGDLYNAAKLAGMTMEEFNELRIKAGIPSIG